MDKQKIKEYIKYILITGALLAVIVCIVVNYKGIFSYISGFFKIIRPLIIGGAMAFVLNRPVLYFQKVLINCFNKDRKKLNKKTGEVKSYYGLSIATTYVVFLIIVSGIIWFIIPQLVSSVSFFIDNFDSYYNNFTKMFEDRFGYIDFAILEENDIIKSIYEKLYALTEYIPEFLAKTFGITKGIITGVVDIFIGLIFSIYVLADKKKLKRQVSRLTMVLLKEKNYRKISSLYTLVSKQFSQFINGQLTEAFILGILCFVGMSIFRFEYAVLISVIIGVTNLIPIFGPIFGTIPCALILLLVNPIHAIWFVVFIIILQQIDSNVIYPRVVGNSVGLGPMWILLSITIGGGLFGVLGMILSVPAMSVIYTLVGKFVNKKYIQTYNVSKKTFQSNKKG